MKLPIICSECMRENVATAQPFSILEWRDDGRYETTCPKGHTSITILQEQKFELLFDIGAYALADGYYREAVSSFTSSLERFYEFFITAVLFEKCTSTDVFEKSWKLVASQSERQLGAFIFLYTDELEKPPALLKPKFVEFRNGVTHKGNIPTRAEAIEYGEAVLGVIRPLLREVREKFPKGVQATIVRHLQQCRRAPLESPATISIATILGLSRPDENYQKRSLETAIKELRRW